MSFRSRLERLERDRPSPPTPAVAARLRADSIARLELQFAGIRDRLGPVASPSLQDVRARLISTLINHQDRR